MKDPTVSTITGMSVSYDLNYGAMLSRCTTNVLRKGLKEETRKNAQRLIRRELRLRGVAI